MSDPSSEEKRLAALREYALLDTSPERTFDNVTLLAAQICGTPIALISLIDDHRQWFKSHHGLDMTEGPREESFCRLAMTATELFVVANALDDDRFRDNPLVTGAPGVVFYAGAPLSSSDGERLGTLCVIDHVPRTLTTEQKLALKALADQVMSLFEARRIGARLAHKEREIAESRQRLIETVKAMPVAVAFLEGPEHRYSFTNEKHATYFGGRADFVGKTILEAIPELAGTAIPSELDRVYQTGVPFLGEEVRMDFAQADGHAETFYLRVNFQPLRELSGAISGIVSTVVDVTSNVRARAALIAKNDLVVETQRLLSAATRVANVGFYEWKIKPNVVTFSEQMQKDWGIAAGVSIEDVMMRVLPEDRAEVNQKVAEAMRTGEPYFCQYRITRGSGLVGHVWIEAQGQCTYDEDHQPVAFIGTSIDITSRKAIERDAQAVANSIPQMAWMAEADGRMIWFNQRWYDYTGTNFNEVHGWGWCSVQHPDHRDRVVQKLKSHLDSGEPWEDVFPIRAATGEYRWFLSRAVPLKDDAGQVTRWFGSNTDITAQRESDRQVARLAAVIESTQDFIGLMDTTFRPIFLNHAGRTQLGFGQRDVGSSVLFDFFAEADRATVKDEVLPALARDGYWEGELNFRHFTSGASIPVLFNLFPVKDRDVGELIGYGTVARDISERKRMEVSLREAKDAAERANGAKSVFLANMSHEIRSPLGAIMGFSELIKNSNLTPDEFANFIAVIDRNSHHLLRIVDDILDLSKVEAGKMLIERNEFALPELLADFTSIMRFRARDKGIEFDLHVNTAIPDVVISDPTRLRQILNNVVGNAIKFTDRGRVELVVSYDRPHLEFTIRDTGSGIEPAQIARLFQPFQQADVSTTRKYGGTGLGLALTRRLSEAMGGSFELVETEVGHGSTFRAIVTIELGASSHLVQSSALNFAAPNLKAVSSSRSLEGVKILVIEDSPDNQDLFRLMLTRLGAAIEIAGDGVEGVAAAVAGDYDLVLCDVQMPRMDGYEATRELRARGYAKPIVALTAHAMREERDRALASGFTDFLSKPVERDALVKVILRWVRRGG